MSPPVLVKAELWYDGQWNDITSDVRGLTAPGGGVHIERGASPESTRLRTSRGSCTINNGNGRYSPRNELSPLFGKIGRNTPIRFSVEDSAVAAEDQVRWVAEVPYWPQEWAAEAVLWVPLELAGLSRRLSQGVNHVASALIRHYSSLGATLVAYVPLEDGPETHRTAVNVVPGTSPVQYSTGGAPDYERRPRFARDDSCPGSAPLPDWPVIEYFGWSQGSSVAAHSPPWQVHVTIRVPPGSGEVYLGEWRTTGTLQDWQLRANSSGQLYVRATDGAESSPRVETWTSTEDPVDDGLWRTVAVTHIASSVAGDAFTFITVHDEDESFSVSSAEVGRVDAIRPRPMFVSTAGDPDPLGLGHMVVLGTVGGTHPTIAADVGPTLGNRGEPAATRALRMGKELDVPVRVPALDYDRDTFTRSEASGWGDTEGLGQTWTTTSTHTTTPVAFSVNGSSAVMELAEAFSVGDAEIDAPEDLDVVVVIELVSDTAADRQVLIRDGLYYVQIGGATDDILTLLRWNGSSYAQLALRQFVVGYFGAGEVIYLRLQALGGRIRARVWNEDQREPHRWHITYSDSDPHSGTGLILLTATVDADTTVHFHDLDVNHADTSTRMGPQKRDTILANFGDIATTDAGIIAEDRRQLGYLYVPALGMRNLSPTLEIAYGTGYLRGLRPVEDDRLLWNDVTVREPGGTSARSVQETGQLNTGNPADDPQAAGRYDRGPLTVNVASPLQLPGHARHRRHHGTVNEPRYPLISVDLATDRWQGDDTKRAAAAAADVGRLVKVTDFSPAGVAVAGARDVLALVRGPNETLSGYTWVLDWVTTPASPHKVAVREDSGGSPGPADPVRRSPAGSTLDTQVVAGTDTTMDVAVGTGQGWGTTGQPNMHFPLDVEVEGARIRVTAIGALSAGVQTFTISTTVVNGVEKTIPAGTEVRLWQDAVRAL